MQHLQVGYFIAVFIIQWKQVLGTCPLMMKIVPEYIFSARPKQQDSATRFGSFKNVLYKYLDQPAQNAADIFMETTEFVVVYDAYPKAKIHLLIIPKREYWSCETIDSLDRSQISRLESMHDLARQIVESPSIIEALKDPAVRDPQIELL